MLAILVLFVLVLIVFQITLGSSTDSRVAKNDLQLTVFDAAIESALIKSMQDLADDAAASAEAESDPAAGGAGFPDTAGGGGEAAGSLDSRRDDWARPQQTEINGVSLRVLIQDEDSKYNVLTMLTENQEEAEKAFLRVVRILDMCRSGTQSDIEESDAKDMAEAMRDFMRDRADTVLPRPSLLTDRPGEGDVGFPLTLREFVVLPGFNEFMFRDYRDAEGIVVHSIGSFLTISTSVSTYQEYYDALKEAAGPGGVPPADGPMTSSGSGASSGQTGGANAGVGARSSDSGASGAGLGDGTAGGGASNGVAGVAVNVNTAPNAVLHGLFDRRDISWEFLDDLVRYRNLEDEEASDPDAEPVYDEYGEEIITMQIFESLEELAEVDGWDLIEPDPKADFTRFLTTESHVFTIFITARATTAGMQGDSFGLSRAEAEELAEQGTDLLRTVRTVVWRYEDGDEFKVVQLEPWEVLDYTPYEVLDYPDADR